VIKRWFVTGTDTEVGKTVASSALLQAANLAGYRTAGYKPVASGSEMTAEGLRNGDALALQANSAVALSYDEVNPYVFAEPTSPHIVSADEGRPIELAQLSAGLRHLEQRAEWLLVEGLGAAGTTAGHFGGGNTAGLHQPCRADRTGYPAGGIAAGRLDRQ